VCRLACLVAGLAAARSAPATTQVAATGGGAVFAAADAGQSVTEPPAPFRQLPAKVPLADGFYNSWSPHRAITVLLGACVGLDADLGWWSRLRVLLGVVFRSGFPLLAYAASYPALG
jgi:hypothetical protein